MTLKERGNYGSDGFDAVRGMGSRAQAAGLAVGA